MPRVESIQAIECYRSNNKAPTELDFVVSSFEKKCAIEVKSSSQVKHQTLSQLLDFVERTSEAEGYIIYTGMPQNEVHSGKSIHFLPPYKLLDIFS